MQIEAPHIIGLIKARNESLIIKDTLDSWSEICTGGIIVLDDKSTDNTVEICRAHPAVKDVLVGSTWDIDRERAEWFNRQTLLNRGKQLATENTWFVYFDADEHLYNFTEYGLFQNPDVRAIACRLFDFYITPSDIDKKYSEREWIGPEYRTIIFFFRNQHGIKYNMPDQRVVTLPDDVGNIPIHGDIKHYGKGFSVEEWEKTCDYYIKFWPKYASKWMKRKGKAIKNDYISDFGNPLILWKDRDEKTIYPLEQQAYGKN